MAECNDCNKDRDLVIIFDDQKKEFFVVCADCISSEDWICPDGLAQKVV
jgi:hypothetical protein